MSGNGQLRLAASSWLSVSLGRFAGWVSNVRRLEALDIPVSDVWNNKNAIATGIRRRIALAEPPDDGFYVLVAIPRL